MRFFTKKLPSTICLVRSEWFCGRRDELDYLPGPIQPPRARQALEPMRGSLTRGGDAYGVASQKVDERLPAGAPRKRATRKGKRIVLLAVNEVIRIAIDLAREAAHQGACYRNGRPESVYLEPDIQNQSTCLK